MAIVTGVSGALGGAVARALADDGAQVVGLHRRDSLDMPDIDAERADVSNSEEVNAAVRRIMDRWGRVDILANIAGGFDAAAIADTSDELWAHMLTLNLTSAFNCCRAVIPFMTAAGSGRIINVSSRTALHPAAGLGAYSVSKMGVITLTETLAAELKGHGVTANAILPSTIDTAANRQAMPNARFEQWVAPETIAKIVVDLASDRWAAVSGASIPVYGNA